MIDKAERNISVTKLSPEDKIELLAFGKRARSLSSTKGDDISVLCEVDLSLRYTHLFRELREYRGPFDFGVANKVHSAVFKPVPKVPKNTKGRVSVNRASLALAAEILGEAINRASRRSKDARGLERLIKRCGSTLTGLAGASNDGFAWGQVAAFFQDAASVAGQPFDSLVSERNLGAVFAEVKLGLTHGLLSLLQSGDVSAARRLLGSCKRHFMLDDACRSVLQTALSESASTLPRESQELAMRFLGITDQSERIEYANPAESPEMRQAAALLLYLFDVRERSPELDESFERYRTVAQNQFDLHLRGSVGSKVSYDPRLHELPEASVPAPLVKVIRPWVEWYKPPDARVVIRGIVEPEATVKGDLI